MDKVKEYLNQWSSSYKEDLLTNIMPFWMQFGWDRKHGGVYTCVNRDGSLMDTTKSVWFQGRFAFVCSFAYNMPYAVVDGNVYRVLSRYYGISVPIDTTQGKKHFAAFAQHILVYFQVIKGMNL